MHLFPIQNPVIPTVPAVVPAPKQTQTALSPRSAATVKTEQGRSTEIGDEAASRSAVWNRALLWLWPLGAVIGWISLLVGIARMNQYAAAGHTSTPVVAGFPRARILLPDGWPGDLSDAEAAAALCHEESHLRRMHVAGRIFVEAFRRWLWWLPFSHLLVRIYDQSLEEIADADAVAKYSPAVLASALLKVASHDGQPYLCTGAKTSKNDLEARIRSIMNLKSPGRLSTAIFLSLAALATALGLSPRPSQDQVASFGLQLGARWTYRIDYPNQKEPQESALLTQVVDKVIPETAQTVYQLRTQLASGLSGGAQAARTREPGYVYRATRDDGLYALHNRSMMGPGYDSSSPDRLFKKPFKVGAQWKWRAPFRGQIAIGPGDQPPKMDDLAQDCTARVEAQEDVKIEAGTFRCFRVRVTRVSKAGPASDETQWYSLERGLIKSVSRSEGQIASIWTLTKYEVLPGQQAAENKALTVNVRGLKQDLEAATLDLTSKETYQSLRVPRENRIGFHGAGTISQRTFKPGEAVYLMVRNFPYVSNNLVGPNAAKQSAPAYVNIVTKGATFGKNMTIESQQFNRPHVAPISASKLNQVDGMVVYAIYIPREAPSQEVEIVVTLSVIAGTDRKPYSVSPPACKLTFRVVR